MNISELIRHQSLWEEIRGIRNQNLGADRIQVELDEAKVEDDYHKRLMEYIDVLIITCGSIGVVAKLLDYEYEDVEDLLKAKLQINDVKYGLWDWDPNDVEGSIQRARERWEE